MPRLLIIPAFVAALAAASPLLASSDGPKGVDIPRDQWLSVSEIATSFEAKGYVIHEIEIEDGVYEVEAVDANGMRVEVYVHPVTGEALPDHDDD